MSGRRVAVALTALLALAAAAVLLAQPAVEDAPIPCAAEAAYAADMATAASVARRHPLLGRQRDAMTGFEILAVRAVFDCLARR